MACRVVILTKRSGRKKAYRGFSDDRAVHSTRESTRPRAQTRPAPPTARCVRFGGRRQSARAGIATRRHRLTFIRLNGNGKKKAARENSKKTGTPAEEKKPVLLKEARRHADTHTTHTCACRIGRGEPRVPSRATRPKLSLSRVERQKKRNSSESGKGGVFLAALAVPAASSSSSSSSTKQHAKGAAAAAPSRTRSRKKTERGGARAFFGGVFEWCCGVWCWGARWQGL